MLYAIVIGLLLSLATGGRLAGLASIRLRYLWLAAAGFLIQVVIFFGPVSVQVGDLGPPLYVASTAIVLAVVIANRRIPGLWIVIVGAACNLAAILANGGYMPADPDALASLGHGVNPGYSNSQVVAEPALRLLTDIFALPQGLPYANVFSVGDVLIGVGVVAVIVLATRPGTAQLAAASPAGETAERTASTAGRVVRPGSDPTVWED